MNLKVRRLRGYFIAALQVMYLPSMSDKTVFRCAVKRERMHTILRQAGERHLRNFHPRLMFATAFNDCHASGLHATNITSHVHGEPQYQLFSGMLQSPENRLGDSK